MSDEDLAGPLEGRITRVESEVKHMRAEMSAISSTLSTIAAQVANIGKPNWSTFIGFAGLLFPLIAAGYFFVTLNMQAVISPLASKSERSETDRFHLNASVASMDDRLNDLYAEVRSNSAKVSAQITEIETQFASTAQLSNMRAASSQQLVQLLWQKVYGEPLPDGEFFYNMSQTRAHPGEIK